MTTATDPMLNPDAPCAHCGGPTLRGVNSDFCSARCERAYVESEDARAEDAAEWLAESRADMRRYGEERVYGDDDA